ncbi:hypothetical protein CFV95_000790 [Leptospira interrogans]|uniref:Uncharacterized protein n=1 Tax=Leptospira interrogans TaxID=173 RepID=A0AAV9FNQ8_LEPIR|nr:hypothetical protein [Leptospira interrogans]KAK2617651.1 hypothetical protein CFV95_000790 [Leptospira interrogans]
MIQKIANPFLTFQRSLILYLKTCKNNNIIWSLGDTHNAPDIVLLRKIEQLKWINLLVSPSMTNKYPYYLKQ